MCAHRKGHSLCLAASLGGQPPAAVASRLRSLLAASMPPSWLLQHLPITSKPLFFGGEEGVAKPNALIDILLKFEWIGSESNFKIDTCVYLAKELKRTSSFTLAGVNKIDVTRKQWILVAKSIIFAHNFRQKQVTKIPCNRSSLTAATQLTV